MSARQLCFNTTTDQICLQVTPLSQGDVLQTQISRTFTPGLDTGASYLGNLTSIQADLNAQLGFSGF